jgi:hypothetical protein
MILTLFFFRLFYSINFYCQDNCDVKILDSILYSCFRLASWLYYALKSLLVLICYQSFITKLEIKYPGQFQIIMLVLYYDIHCLFSGEKILQLKEF